MTFPTPVQRRWALPTRREKRSSFEAATSDVCGKYLAQRVIRIKWIYLCSLFKLIFRLIKCLCSSYYMPGLFNINALTSRNSMGEAQL